MKVKILAILTVVFVLALVAAWAADVTGKWEAEQAGRDGTPTKTTFAFKVAGTTLTGTVTNPQGEVTISEGKVEGDTITFVTVRKFGENEMKQTWTGKVSGDEISFTRQMQMPPGGFGGAPGGGGGAPGGGAPAAGAPGGGAPGGGAPGGGGGGGGRGGGQPLIAKRVK
jgi:hypothetical protein